MTAVLSCACGMFSVGACMACQSYVCGHHGRLVAGRFLCQKHAVAEETAAAATALRAEEQAKAAAKTPCPMTLFEEVRSITDAAAASQQARADAARNAEERAAVIAAELLPELVSLIREVLAMTGARSVSYEVRGSRRDFKWGSKRTADTGRIGTHVSDRLDGGRAGWFPCSKYTGVWPAMAWHTGWTVPRNGDFSPEPMLSSLWFNANGLVVAGSSLRNGGLWTTPEVSFYCSGGAPSGAHSRATWHRLLTCSDPVNVDELRVDHLLRICKQALSAPTLLRKSLPDCPRSEAERLNMGTGRASLLQIASSRPCSRCWCGLANSPPVPPWRRCRTCGIEDLLVL